jgi:nitrilase
LKCFVINSVAVVDETLIDAYGSDDATRAYLQEAKLRGGACIIGPGGQILAGPMPGGEGILYADVDADDVIVPKFIHDFAGHYNRPELFAPLFQTSRRALADSTGQTSDEREVGERTRLAERSITLLPPSE